MPARIGGSSQVPAVGQPAGTGSKDQNAPKPEAQQNRRGAVDAATPKNATKCKRSRGDGTVSRKRQASADGQQDACPPGISSHGQDVGEASRQQKKQKKKRFHNTKWMDIISAVKAKSAETAWEIYSNDPEKDRYTSGQLHTLGSLFLGAISARVRAVQVVARW